MQKIIKMKAIELVFDWNLWPRHNINVLDSTNVTQMKVSLESGYSLPPVIANKADKRLIDGFHRTKAYLDVYGDDAEIDVILEEHDDDASILLRSGTLNAVQGLKLSPKDRAHFSIKCKNLGVSAGEIAKALNMNVAKFEDFIARRTATVEATGEEVPLSNGSKSLAGKSLNEEEENFRRSSTGLIPSAYISMLVTALKADAVSVSPATEEKLIELRDLIDATLKNIKREVEA
jgi:hypothetical protein